MSYETYTERSDEPTSRNEPDEAILDGLRQLPGYESLQARLRAPRTDHRPTKDDIFDILRNRRRRYVLQYLGEQEGVVRLSQLAEALADWEKDDDATYITHRDRKRAYVSLYQTHLPKLDRAGVVEYNQPRGTVERGPDYPYVQRYLDQPHKGTMLWDRLYVLCGAMVAGLLALNGTTAFPFVPVPESAWFVLVFAVFGAVWVAHSLAEREEEVGPYGS